MHFPSPENMLPPSLPPLSLVIVGACCPLPVPKSLAGNFSWSAAVRCGKPRRWWLIQFLPLISSSSFAMAAFAGAAIAAAVAASFAASLCL